jgi:hypothetical protein
MLQDFNAYYQIAYNAAKVKKHDDFAAYLGLSKRTVQRAFGGEISPKTISQARAKLESDNLLHPASPVHLGDNSVLQQQSPSATAGISAEKHAQIISGVLSEMAAQRESYERLLTLAISGKTDK